MFVGKTSNGFEFEIDEDVFDDMELIDYLADLEDDNITSLSRITAKMFGKEQRKKMYDFVRSENGRVSPTVISEMITEVFTAFGEKGKN